MTIDFSKPVTTRDGRPVRILCTDRPGEWPVAGLVGDEIFTWGLDGGFRHSGSSPADLVNPKTKREAWTLIYEDLRLDLKRCPRLLFASKTAAEAYAKDGAYLAVARVEWEE